MNRLRIAAGLTQRHLADAAGVPMSSLQNWEIDRREPGFRAAVRLAKALGVSVEDLADTVPVAEVGKAPRPAGPSRRDAPQPAPKQTRKRKRS
jgi:transcriptional regulator with XRE-family HTH domain